MRALEKVSADLREIEKRFSSVDPTYELAALLRETIEHVKLIETFAVPREYLETMK